MQYPWEATRPVCQLQTRKLQETLTSALLSFLNHFLISPFPRIPISSRIRRWLTFIREFEPGYVVLAPLSVGSTLRRAERPQQQYNPPQVVHFHPCLCAVHWPLVNTVSFSNPVLWNATWGWSRCVCVLNKSHNDHISPGEAVTASGEDHECPHHSLSHFKVCSCGCLSPRCCALFLSDCFK